MKYATVRNIQKRSLTPCFHVTPFKVDKGMVWRWISQLDVGERLMATHIFFMYILGYIDRN